MNILKADFKLRSICLCVGGDQRSWVTLEGEIEMRKDRVRELHSEGGGLRGLGGGRQWKLTSFLMEESNALASRMPLSTLKDQGSDWW